MITLRCPQCGLPVCRVEDRQLLIESRHHGHYHTSTIPVDKLLRLCDTEADLDGNPITGEIVAIVIGRNLAE